MRVINGGRKGQNGDDDLEEEASSRTMRSATEIDLDDDDDGLGSSTIIGVAPSPPTARTAGVGTFDFDDNAIDDVLSGIEDKAVALPPGPQVPARHYPVPSTHGRPQSSHDGTMPPPEQMRYPTGQMHTPPPGQMQHMGYTGHMGHMGHTGHMGAPTPIPGAMLPPPMLHTPEPQSQRQSRAPMFAVAALIAIAIGGFGAYAVVSKGDKKNNTAGSGSGSAGSATSVDSVGSAGSATSDGSAIVATGSAGSAGSDVVPTGSAGSAVVPTGSAGSAAPPQATALKATLVSVEHPAIGDSVTAKSKGQIASVSVAKPRDVKSGEALFTIKSRSGANVDALAKRVSELEALAKEDPDSYGPFLKRARNELRAGQAPIITTIKASSGGMFHSSVKVGDQVTPGSVLGKFVDARTWIGVADAEGTVDGATPTATWSCTVADTTHTAACNIQVTEVINGGSGTRVTVEISATGTSWVEGPSKPWLVLAP